MFPTEEHGSRTRYQEVCGYKPHVVTHTVEGFDELVARLKVLDGEVKNAKEHNGRYYEFFAMSMYRAGFFVSAVNPLMFKGYQEYTVSIAI